MHYSSHLLRRFCLFLTLLAACVLPAGAEMHTLTDQQGRTLQADIVAVDGSQVTVRRDDGQTFTLSLGTLSEADQKWLKEWAAKQDSRIPQGGIELQISRGKFDSKKKDDGGGIILSEEQWGYSVILLNHTSKQLTGLRVEYILFVKPDSEPGKDSTASALKQRTGSNKIDTLAPHTNFTFRTDTISIYKQQLKPGWVWGKTGNNAPVRDTLYGVWLRAYVGDQLVDETCNPETLSKTEKWKSKK
ncbi:MAG: hypothetical protein JF599_08080 [Verrucomicrobia bacterium]|nr:hypothetical protein [Verrucomicrobiota bacterium]